MKASSFFYVVIVAILLAFGYGINADMNKLNAEQATMNNYFQCKAQVMQQGATEDQAVMKCMKS